MAYEPNMPAWKKCGNHENVKVFMEDWNVRVKYCSKCGWIMRVDCWLK
jgi:hypothetical protein